MFSDIKNWLTPSFPSTGNGVLDEVMTSLMHATEMFEEQRATEVQEEEVREAREAVKAEQDAAYMESLKADRAKVRQAGLFWESMRPVRIPGLPPTV